MKKNNYIKLTMLASVALVIASGVHAQDGGLPKSMQRNYKAVHVTLPNEEVKQYAPIPSYSPESDTATNHPTFDNITYDSSASAPTMPVGGLEVNRSVDPKTSAERTYFLDEKGRPVYGQEIPIHLIKQKKLQNKEEPRSEGPVIIKENTAPKVVSSGDREIKILSETTKVWRPVSSAGASNKNIEESNLPKITTPNDEGVVILTPEELEKIPERKTEAKKKSKSGKVDSSGLQIKGLRNYFQRLASNDYQNPLDNIPSFEVTVNDESFVVAQVAQNYQNTQNNDPNVPAYLKKRPAASNNQWQPANQPANSQSEIVEENIKTLPSANVNSISQPENLSEARALAPEPKRPANSNIPANTKAPQVRPIQSVQTLPANFAPVRPVAPNVVTTRPSYSNFMNPYAGSGYSMEQFLAQAYSKNPQLTALREAIKAADEGMPQAFSGFLPRIDLNLNNSLTKSGSGSGNKEDFYPDTQSLDVNQSVFGGGETYYQIKATKDRIYSARYELKAEEQSFLRTAIEAYVNLIFTRKVFNLSQKNESSLTDHLESTRQRFAIGDTTRTDVAQSESRLANAVSNRVSSENDYINAKSVFRRIFLTDAPENLMMPVNLPQLPKNLDDALSISIRNNPNIQRNLYAKNQRDNEIEVQRSQLYPQVDLTGSISQRESVSGTTLFNNEQESVGVNVRVPLYDSGITFSRTREAKDRKSQSEFEYQSSILETRDKVVQAWQALASASLNIEATKAALLAAQYALDGVKEEQREGQRAIFEILDAQREMFSAEVSHARAIRDSVLAMYNLKAAVGQINPSDLRLPVKDYDPEEHYNNTKTKFIGY